MADEVNEGLKTLRGRLIADTAFAALSVPVFAADQVPQDQATPYVLIDPAAGADVNGSGTSRIMSSTSFLVRVVNKGSVDAAVRAADKAMDAALQSIAAVASGDYVFSARRETPYRRSYRDGANNLWSESGGFYRLFVA